MKPTIAIINAFDDNSLFIKHLSAAYTAALEGAGANAATLNVNAMDFKINVDARKFNYETLEPDLQKSIDVITDATAFVIFTSWKPDEEANKKSTAFIKRLFHSDNGHINYEIWGHFQSDSKRVRIIAVIDDEAAAKHYKETRDASVLPVYKADVRLSGFGKIASKVFGLLIGNDIESPFAQASLDKVRALAIKDAGFVPTEDSDF